MKDCCTPQDKNCPVYVAINALSKKWALLILRTLADNPRDLRFTEIQKAVSGINSRMLSDRLSELEEMELVSREVKNTKPILICYKITEKGAGLKDVFEALKEWTEKFPF